MKNFPSFWTIIESPSNLTLPSSSTFDQSETFHLASFNAVAVVWGIKVKKLMAVNAIWANKFLARFTVLPTKIKSVRKNATLCPLQIVICKDFSYPISDILEVMRL